MREPSSPATKTEHPVYRDAIEGVNAFIRKFGETVSVSFDDLDAGGYAEVRYGDLVVGINANQEHGILMFLTRMGDLPAEPDPALLQWLLELNFLATGACSFAIDEQRRRLYLRSMRPIEGLRYEDFENALQSIAQLATTMRKRLTGTA